MDEQKTKFDWKHLLITTAIVLVAAGAVGGTTYYVLNSSFQKERDANEKALNEVQAQLKNEEGKEKTLTTTTTTSSDQIVSNIFDILNLKVGDKVAGMTVVSTAKAAPTSSLPYGPQNAQVNFSGKATLTGSYDYTGNDKPAMIEDFIFFTADAASAKYLPMTKDDQRMTFTFTNADAAKRMLGITIGKSSTGKATIEIDNYSFVIFPGEGSNGATLLSVK